MAVFKDFALIFVFILNFKALEVGGSYNITFHPESIEGQVENQDRDVFYNYTCCYSNNTSINIQSENTGIVDIIRNRTTLFTDAAIGSVIPSSFTIRGNRLGRTTLRVTIHHVPPEQSCSEGGKTPCITKGELVTRYRVAIIREERVEQTIFTVGLAIIVIILTVMMGCSVDLKIIWEVLKKPIAPAIGFLCQFILMPLLGFGISRLLRMESGLGLGLFVVSCSPGGGASNIYTVLLNGDLDLSVTMTFISKIAALGMMPFWMWALGHVYVQDAQITIPFANIGYSLLALVFPIGIGLLIKRFSPKVADFLAKGTKWLSLFFIAYVFSFGIYANLYMYRLMGRQPEVILAGIMLPWVAYGLAFALAMLLKQGVKRATTIAIETGIQDIAIALIVLQFSFPNPEADLAAVMPIATVMFTPLPLVAAFAIISIRKIVITRANKSEMRDIVEDETKSQTENSYYIENSNTEKKIPSIYCVTPICENNITKDPYALGSRL
ncbi:unnamed protein product [Owenia fusiformis]|uniref:Ileal sodium/bile acid cotransporter n=1 Tax=Owenia fusiformis TaxID=6347 RepID=A0A8S4N474_OWEFU|nr:unnamed protein product [Owenia fusiformis]